MINMIAAFILSWLCTLSGVALGGFLVFRTKRDHEPLFRSQQPEGEAFNMLDGQEEQEEPTAGSSARIPDPVQNANDLFVQQFAERLAEGETK